MFYYTTYSGKGKGKHRHIVYAPDEQQPVMTENNKHTHDIIISDAGISISNVNNHIHEPTTEEVTGGELKLPNAGDEAKIVAEAIALHKEACQEDDDNIKDAEEAEGFYHGHGQWKKNEKDALEDKRRAALTINDIQPKIDTLSDNQRQNRTDLRYFPVEDGDSRVADVLNTTAKVLLGSEYPVEETDMCDDGTITGRGFIIPELNYDMDPRGVFHVEHRKWDMLRCGPHARRDLRDCDFLTLHNWFSKNQIEQMYPEKAENVGIELDSFLEKEESNEHTTYQSNQYDHAEGILASVKANPEWVDVAKKEFKVVEVQRKVHRRVPIIIKASDDVYVNADGWKAEDLAAIKTLEGFNVAKVKRSPVAVTTIAAGVLLEYEWASDRPEWIDPDDFSPLVYYAKKRGKRWWGKIGMGEKDVQRENNKRHSQMADILNKVSGKGYLYDDETFQDETQVSAFKKHSSSPDFLLKVANLDRPPLLQEGVRFPAELVGMVQYGAEKLSEVMGVNKPPEKAPAGTSGIALVEAQNISMMPNGFLTDNLSTVKRKLGKRIVMALQKAYSPERIMRILRNENDRAPVMVNGQPLFPGPQMQQQGQMDPQQQQEMMMKMQEIQQLQQTIVELLKNEDLTKYDVAVGESAMNPTRRRANFIEWADLAGKGIPVPPMSLVDMSDVPEKEKLKKEMAAMMKAQAEAEERKYQVELQKPVVAAQAKQQTNGGF